MKGKLVILFTAFILLLVPVAGQEKPLYFILMTDPQFGMYQADKGFERETANYEFAVAAVNRLKPAFVVVLGDLTNKAGDAGQIKEFTRITKKVDPSIPVYLVPGNHDVGHEPTPESIAAYRANVGRDYYSFRAGPVYGIVLDSTVILVSKNAETEYQAQISWFKKELAAAKDSGARHIIVFQHHPYFTNEPNESDSWGNIPLERRRALLELMHGAGVRCVFAGHVHKNSAAKDGDLEMTAIGPVGMPFGEDGSGILLAYVTDSGVQHRYYGFGKMPDTLGLK